MSFRYSLYSHTVGPPGILLTVTKVADMLGIAVFRGNPVPFFGGGGRALSSETQGPPMARDGLLVKRRTVMDSLF